MNLKRILVVLPIAAISMMLGCNTSLNPASSDSYNSTDAARNSTKTEVITSDTLKQKCGHHGTKKYGNIFDLLQLTDAQIDSIGVIKGKYDSLVKNVLSLNHDSSRTVIHALVEPVFEQMKTEITAVLTDSQKAILDSLITVKNSSDSAMVYNRESKFIEMLSEKLTLTEEQLALMKAVLIDQTLTPQEIHEKIIAILTDDQKATLKNPPKQSHERGDGCKGGKPAHHR